MRAATFPNTHIWTPDTLTAILRAYPAKVLARLSGASYRTTERWRSGQTKPRRERLDEMMRRNDALAAAIRSQVFPPCR